MTRRGSLAEQLAALRAYVTIPDHEPEPMQTNWSTIPANDNEPEVVADMQVERRWRMKPSTAEIIRQVETGEVERNSAGQVVRIGSLKFSDGTQTEQAMKVTIDGKVVSFQARMPVGAMLGMKDAAESQLGGEEDGQHVTASNSYFAEVFDTLPHRYKAGGKRRRGKNYTRAESVELLAAAASNTDMSKVVRTYYPTGLPCGSAKVADSFLGMQKGKKGESGSVMWQDIVSAREARIAWGWAVAALADDDRRVLDTAVSAKTYADVGVAAGQTRNYADKKSGGRRALIAANDNLAQAIKNYVA